MIKGRMYFQGFSKMEKCDLLHQKELWKEERERCNPWSHDIASVKILMINLVLFKKRLNENVGKVISVFVYMILAVTLLL